MEPKFMKFAVDEKQHTQWKIIYEKLPKRQKVRWRKEMHRALKQKLGKVQKQTKQDLSPVI